MMYPQFQNTTLGYKCWEIYIINSIEQIKKNPINKIKKDNFIKTFNNFYKEFHNDIIKFFIEKNIIFPELLEFNNLFINESLKFYISIFHQLNNDDNLPLDLSNRK